MNQHHSHYHLEKMMQHRERELTSAIRQGKYVKEIKQCHTKVANAGVQRGFWQRWFGSKRLNTSWK